MSIADWNIFRTKFSGKEQIAFEDFSYQLFCTEHNIKIGIMGYKNQTGIEKDLIFIDNEYIGFQAKFYDTKISEKKADILDSIYKAKNKNPKINKIFVYLNKDFSESSKADKKDPRCKIQIEQKAKEFGVTIVWRVPSYLDRQLLLEENKYIYNHFFNLGKSVIDAIRELKDKTATILLPIASKIQFNGQTIKIDRSKQVDELSSGCRDGSVIVVYGQGGTGKTALVKDLYDKDNNNVYIIKASELENISNINELFKNYEISLDDFIEIHKNETRKIFIIDSAEKLSDIQNKDVIQEFLTTLNKNKWSIILTTRNSYLQGLDVILLDRLKLPFKQIQVSNLNNEELFLFATTYKFNLPKNTKVQELILNPSYLNIYLNKISNFHDDIDLNNFKNTIWKQKIQDISFTKEGLNLRREKLFLDIVKKHCEDGSFYIFLEINDCNALNALKKDGIIGEDQGGYFIAHDIYEEWALEKIINDAFYSVITTTNWQLFFNNIGSSLPIRKTFRKWAQNKVDNEYEQIHDFLKKTLFEDTYNDFLKNEIWIAILLSNNSKIFLDEIEKRILSNKFALLQRLISYLRIACKDLDINKLQQLNLYPLKDNIDAAMFFIKPVGSGWNSIIEIIYRNKNKFEEDEIEYISQLLLDWCEYYDTGISTKQAGELGIYFYEKANIGYYHEDSIEEKYIKIIINSSFEIKDILKEKLDDYSNDQTKRKNNNKYYYLCKYILTNPFESLRILKAIPLQILKILDKFWYHIDDEDKETLLGYVRHKYTEDYYHITNEYDFKYFPPSAYQTPVYFLLKLAQKETMSFILNFINKTVKYYKNNNEYDSVIDVDVCYDNDKKRKQYLSSAIWNMHRGNESPVVPYLLQSLHMALERFLFDISKSFTKEEMEKLLNNLIKDSCSASITSVVTSIVLSDYNKYFNIAKNLFKTIGFIQLDQQRAKILEYHNTNLMFTGLNPINSIFENERKEAEKLFDRKCSLEDILVKYQFFRTESITEEEVESRQKVIWNIIDEHLANISKLNKNSEEYQNKYILLSRIDRRKMTPTFEQIDEKNIKILLNPKIEDEDIKKHSDQSMQEYTEQNKYLELNLWAEYKFRNDERSKEYKKYDNKLSLILKETKEVLERIQKASCEDFNLSEDRIPILVSAILMRDYFENITDDDKIFCRDIVFSYIKRVFNKNYVYQVSDGINEAIQTLPYILKAFPEDVKIIKKYLLLILLFRNWEQRIKNTSIYVMQSGNEQLAHSLRLSYMKLYPALAEQLKTTYMKNDIFQDFVNQNNNEMEKLYEETDKLPISFYDFHSAFTILRTFPYDTVNQKHLDFIIKFTEKYIHSLLSDRRKHSYIILGDIKEEDTNECEYENIDYEERVYFYMFYSNFLINRSISEIDKYIDTISDNFISTKYLPLFLQKIISSAIILDRYESFWHIWERIYEKIKTILTAKTNHTDDIIHSYLFVNGIWNKNVQDWKIIYIQNASFFNKVVQEIGSSHYVLYSIAKFLCEIGIIFIDDGLLWIAEMLFKYKYSRLEKNTIWYLEQFIGNYIYTRTKTIKNELKTKENVINILNFLIDNGSTKAFILKDNFI